MKRFKNLAVTIAMLLVCAVQASAHDFQVDGIYYNYYYESGYNNTVEVTSRDGNSNSYAGVVDIPSTVNYDGVDYQVIRIGSRAFYDCSGLISVVIPEGVLSIGSEAFSSSYNLYSVTIPASVTSIEGSAFYNCNSITYIEIPEGVTSIEDYTFYSCSGLVSIAIPESVNSIGYEAFGYCRGLSSIRIPQGVTSIGGCAFYGCSGLYSIEIPEGVTSIKDYTFYDCNGLNSIVIPESVTSIGDNAFGFCSGLSSIQIPQGVTNIGRDAFYYCRNLSSITFSDNLVSIGDNAFYETRWYNNLSNGVVYLGKTLYGYKGTMPQGTSIDVEEGTKYINSSAFSGCSGLSSITIPESVISIGSNVFQGCDNLTSILVSAANEVYDSRNSCNAVIETSSNKLISGCSATVISNTVTCIGYGAFYECRNLASMIIPESVERIEGYAFYNCDKLTSIIIPEGVINIDNYAFYGCDNLGSVTVSENIKSIGSDAFYGTAWYNNQPNGVVYIGNVLYKYKGTMPENTAIEVKEGTVSILSNAFQWNEKLVSIVIPESVKSIGDYAFRYCSNITSVVIPNSVMTMGNGAFAYCSNLSSVSISESLLSKVYEHAFRSTPWWNAWLTNQPDGLIYMGSVLYKYKGTMPENTEIIVREGTTKINGSAFSDCKGLISVKLPSSVTNIDWNAFYGCSGLTSITIPSSVLEIGNSAFSGCTGLTSINIPSSVRSIGWNAFYRCDNLTAVHIEDIESWCNINFSSSDANPLYYAKKLHLNDELVKELSIPESIITIKENVFYNCKGLISITIPESVTSIGSAAFSGCSGLSSITIPESVTEIGGYAFSGCNGLSSITIPASVTEIGGSAFFGCSGEVIVHCNIPSSSEDSWSSDRVFYGSKFNKVVIGDEVTSIGDYAFCYCDSLRTIVLGNNVENIGRHAFYCYDSSLDNLYIGSIDAWLNISFADNYARPNNYAKNVYLDGELIADITIPSIITSIPEYAFRNFTHLSSITIPESVTCIENYAFDNCSSLQNVVFEDGSNTLTLGYNNYYYDNYNTAQGLFYDCPLDSLYLGRNLNYNTYSDYGYSPFYNNLNLKSVAIGESVTSISNNMFSGCSNLSAVHIKDITSWCKINFSSYSSNPLSLAKNLYLNGKLVSDLLLPNTLTNIKSYAFYGSNLNSITIPNSVTSIGTSAFYGGVKKVNMEAGVPPTLSSSNNLISTCGIFIVPDSALSSYQTARYWSDLVGCISSMGTYKREVTLEAMSKQSALHQALGDAALPYVVDLTINGTINSYDFMVMLNKMNRLRSLDLTNAHVVYNGYEHYTGYHSENNKLPAYAFYQKDLASVKLPQNITSIGDRAFSDCTGLSAITIPVSVKSVGSYAFYNCDGLMRVSLEGTSSIGSYAFSSCNSLSLVDMPEGVSSISNNAFSGCNKLVAFNVSKTVSSVGSYAFSGCSSLKSLTIPKISGSLGSYAFQNCSNLESFSVLDGSTSIGDYAFEGCRNLKVVSLDEVSTIGREAFGDSYSSSYSCSNLTSFTVLKGLTSIGYYAFGYCTKLKDVNLPEGNISIGSNAFYYCSGLREINIPDGVTSIGSSAFTNCSGLKSIKLPTTLQTINSSAFSNCSSLAEVHIPSSVRNIHESAFSGCNNMKKVYVYTIEPTAISQNTFAMNSNNNFVGTLYAPKVSYYVYWYDTQWSQFEDIQPFDEPYDNFYLKGDLELNDSTGVVQGTEGEKPDAELGSNSGLVTDGNIDQELGDVEIEHDGTNGGSIVAGGNSSVEVDNLTFRITVKGGRWYFFCFPFDVRREDIRCENGADWVFRYYDGEERAHNGKGGWKNVSSDGDGNHLKAATGYIFQCSKNDVLIISAKNQKIKQEKKYNELVEHVTQNMQDASWNFVGNPYLSYYDITGEEYSAPITIWNGSSYVAIRPGDDDYVLSPFEAFFVQKPEGVNDIEYDPEQQMTYYQMRMAAEMKAARRRTQMINPDRLLVNLTLSDTATTDRTRVVFNNEVSLDYEMDCDAAKFTANGVPQLYTIGNRAVKYAINERPVTEGIVTVGYTAPVQGNYTLAAPRMDVPVCLKDNRTGIIHDFSEGSYTFMTEAGTFEDRFTLMMKSDATSIDKSQLIIDEEAPLYNTKGQWVDEPQGQGVYIKDNRKVVKL